MQYESFWFERYMAKVKVFVHVTDADAEDRAMTLALRTYLFQLPNKEFQWMVELIFLIPCIKRMFFKAHL